MGRTAIAIHSAKHATRNINRAIHNGRISDDPIATTVLVGNNGNQPTIKVGVGNATINAAVTTEEGNKISLATTLTTVQTIV